MSKGFLTIAQNGEYDYVRMAYALAMSLKLSQKKYNKLSIIVNKHQVIPDYYKEVFDKIFYIDEPGEIWKVQNKYQYYNLTPYDETMVLDCDMLFFYDISLWWDYIDESDIEFTTEVRNYTNKITTSDYYRKVFTNNDLPNLYTALFYFKKTPIIEQYFKLVEVIFKNWKVFYEKFLKEPPKFLSGDVVYSLAAKIFFNRNWSSDLSFIHMRSRIQDDNINDWRKELPICFSNLSNEIKVNLKVNNFNQLYPFHYIRKEFLSEEVIDIYEEAIRLL